jgi:hypothetical protein
MTDFEKAVDSLTAGRFKKPEIQKLWKHLTENGKYHQMDRYQFRSAFDDMQYNGNSTVRTLKSAPAGARATIVSQSSSSS